MNEDAFEVFIDGQCVTVLTNDCWNSLLCAPLYKERPVYAASTENLVRNLVRLVSDNCECFALGVFEQKYLTKSWGVVPLYKLDTGWQRVQIEYVACSSCDWKGLIANPTEASLYFGLGDDWELTKKASSLTRVGCPRCTETLPRFAIWTEVDNGEKN